jgi:hypothetical protein
MIVRAADAMINMESRARLHNATAEWNQKRFGTNNLLWIRTFFRLQVNPTFHDKESKKALQCIIRDENNCQINQSERKELHNIRTCKKQVRDEAITNTKRQRQLLIIALFFFTGGLFT